MTEPDVQHNGFVRDLLAQDEGLEAIDFEAVRGNILERVGVAKRREKLARHILLAFGALALVAWLLLALANVGLVGDTSRWREITKQSAATAFFLLPVMFMLLAGIYIFRHYRGFQKARTDAQEMKLADLEAKIAELRKARAATVRAIEESSRLPPGFSLLELLTVISILGLLAALLTPALQNARNRASRIACQNNLSQLARAMAMYLGDHHVYPGTAINPIRPVKPHSTQPVEQALLWDEFLSPYLPGMEKTMSCPVHRPSIYEKTSGTGYRANYNYGYNALGTDESSSGCLGLGMWLVSGTNPQGLVLASKILVKESQVRIPSEMVELAERQGGDTFCTPIVAPGSLAVSSGNDPSNRHDGGSSVAFCDSHIEYASQLQWKGSSATQRARWNLDNLPHTAHGER